MHCSTTKEEEDNFSNKMSEKHVRVAVIGNVDAGKSSLIGTLKSGQLDNGRGLSSDLKSRPDVRLQLHHICWVTMKIQSQSLPTARREERK